MCTVIDCEDEDGKYLEYSEELYIMMLYTQRGARCLLVAL